MMKESPVAALTTEASASAADSAESSLNGSPAADVEAAAGKADASDVAVIAEIEKVMAAIRPAVQADKGDVEFVSFDSDTGIVEVELQGACQSCPASSATLKSGIERIMKDRVPSVTEVVNVGQVFYSDGTAVTL